MSRTGQGKPRGDYSTRSFVGTPATAPGPVGPQMLRAMGAIRRNPLAYLERTWRQYGDVVQFPIPRPPSYLVNDPEGVRRVLVGNARNYGKSTIQYRALSLVTGEGLLVADTPAWRRQRPLVQPAFHHETLERIVAHVDVAVARMFARWDAVPSDATVDVDEAMMHAALEVVGHALFGTDLSADAERLASATLSALDVVIARARVPITPPAWIPTPGNRRLSSSVRELDGAVGRMMDDRRRRPADVPADMLDLLMATTDETGAGLGVREIRDQVVTFIVAGHETVASALTWAWALLATHPQEQALLQEEADAVLGGRSATFDDYGRLPRARAVLDEALRLVSAGVADHPLIPRRRRGGWSRDPRLGPGDPEPVAAPPPSRPVARSRAVPPGSIPRRRRGPERIHPVRSRAAAVHRPGLRLRGGRADAGGDRRPLHALSAARSLDACGRTPRDRPPGRGTAHARGSSLSRRAGRQAEISPW